jgi:hypothetical protein
MWPPFIPLWMSWMRSWTGPRDANIPKVTLAWAIGSEPRRFWSRTSILTTFSSFDNFLTGISMCWNCQTGFLPPFTQTLDRHCCCFPTWMKTKGSILFKGPPRLTFKWADSTVRRKYPVRGITNPTGYCTTATCGCIIIYGCWTTAIWG